MTAVTISKLRDKLADLTNQVAFQGERIAIERNGKFLVALVSFEDMQLLEDLEDQMDLEIAKKALKRGKFIALEDLKKELGI